MRVRARLRFVIATAAVVAATTTSCDQIPFLGGGDEAQKRLETMQSQAAEMKMQAADMKKQAQTMAKQAAALKKQ